MVISNHPPAYRESQKHSMCNESIRVSPVIHAQERSRMFQMQEVQVIHHQQNHSHLHGYPTSSTGIQKRSVVYKFIPT